MAEDWKRAIWKIEKLEKMMEYFNGHGCPYEGTIIDLCRSEIERIKIEHRSSCSYCEGIERATKASPRKKYRYCPMCGREREKKWRDGYQSIDDK